MNLSDFHYNLPEELIAQYPAKRRDQSRLLVLNKKSGDISHRKFFEIEKYLQPNDILIMNNSKVFPARIFGRKEISGGKVEILLNSPCGDYDWQVIGKGLKPGTRIIFDGSALTAAVMEKREETYLVRFNLSGEKLFDELEAIGQIPLPPYIKRIKNPCLAGRQEESRIKTEDDKKRYQTVYAKERGSVAAPTAGLHFTPELLDSISRGQTAIEYVTLHVGLGTFQPVKTDKIEQHKMHKEYYTISYNVIQKIIEAKKRGGRVIAVGTTTCRVLETAFKTMENNLNTKDFGTEKSLSGWTDIFIYPPYDFQCVDTLITNFHLPESTLLMLVSALAGKENIKNAYATAIEQKYRFFSYGDAMLII